MIRRVRSTALLLGALGVLGGSGTAMAAPPDGRGYELVTPGAEKGAGEISSLFVQVAPSGDRVAYTVNNVFGDDPTHAMTDLGASLPYASDRTASGWVSRFRGDVPLPDFVSQDRFTTVFFGGSRDLSNLFLDVIYGPASGLEESAGAWRVGSDGVGELMAAKPIGVTAPKIVGSSDDGSHVVMWAHRNAVLAPVPGNPAITGARLYEYADGVVRLVNVDDAGNVLHLTGGVFGASAAATGTSSGSTSTVRNAISADGSRIFFTSKIPGAAGADPFHLYVRIDGERTVLLSESAHSEPRPAPTAVIFAGATADGTKAYFTTTGRLTDDATGSGPFLYEASLPQGATSSTLTLVGGVDHPVAQSVGSRTIPQVAVADDGSRVYWASNDDGGTIFVYDAATRTTKVAARGTGTARLQTYLDSTVYSPGYADLNSDGSRLVFLTSADLVAEDTYAGTQVYAYDAVAEKLELISKGPSAPATFNAEFLNDTPDVLWSQRSAPDANFVSDDGSLIFFETDAGLVPQDTNGVKDVYRSKDGAVELVTDGISPGVSYLLGASADGSSVFFMTQNDLLPQDGDDSWDVYTARVGGGFPPPPAREPCVGDACQAPPTPAWFLPVPATSIFSGAGNTEDPEIADATFRVGKISAAAKRSLARTGKLTVVVRTSDAGMVAAKLSAKLGKRWRAADTAVARRGSRGTVKLKLSLSPAARRYLRTHKKGMSVRVDVTYSASDEGRRASFKITPPASKRGAR